MPILSKRWTVRPPCSPDHLARFPHLNQLLVQVLYNRGVNNPDEVTAFLSGTLRHQALGLRGMAEAVDRIRYAIRSGQSIAVYGDFDADGVTATALLVQALKAFGVRVTPYIPHRVDEGYGLNCDALATKIKPWGAGLVITVDCGIRSAKEAEYARALGMDMIITDHHDVGAALPPALAVINPKQANCAYPFKGLSGAGLAYKLVEALLDAEAEAPVAQAPVTLDREDLIDLVALGTVADIVPLLGENRSLVKRGLAQLRAARRPGIQAMLEEARLPADRVDAYAIGFVLGPRLNAAGRLESARVAYDILRTPDPAEAAKLARRLGDLNRQRQAETLALVARVRAEIDRQGPGRYLYLSSGQDYKRGIVGLAAGRLADELYRPVLVAELGEDTIHGSARSIPEFNITAALDRVKSEDDGLLIRYGGHAMAAGFTAPAARADELAARLEAIAAETLDGQALQPALDIDAEVRLGDLDYATQEVLAQLEPCGNANAQPLLCALGLEVVECRLVGRESQHLKMLVRDHNGDGPLRGVLWDAIAFGGAGWYERLPKCLDLAFALESNEFNGQRRLQLNVKDLREPCR